MEIKLLVDCEVRGIARKKGFIAACNMIEGMEKIEKKEAVQVHSKSWDAKKHKRLNPPRNQRNRTPKPAKEDQPNKPGKSTNGDKDGKE